MEKTQGDENKGNYVFYSRDDGNGEGTMERVRAKFTVSKILTDKNSNSLVKLYAVYKGDESSPENESFSNSTPSGSAELYITNPAAIEFFEKLAGKYVYLDFTEAIAS